MNLQFKTITDELKKIAAVHDVRLTEQTFEVWFEDLSDLPDEVVQASFRELRKSFKPRFYGDRPTPSHIREHIVKVCSKEWTDAYEECLVNASQIQSPVHYTGPGGELLQRQVVWSSPMVKKCFDDFGGHRAFLEAEHGDRTIRAQFRDVYQRLQNRIQGNQSLALPQTNTMGDQVAIKAGNRVIEFPVKLIPKAKGE